MTIFLPGHGDQHCLRSACFSCFFLCAWCRLQASDKDWAQLQGKFLLNSTVAKATIYIEGPKAGVDLLLDCLVVKHAQKAPPCSPPDFEVNAGHPSTFSTTRSAELSHYCLHQALHAQYVQYNAKLKTVQLKATATLYVCADHKALTTRSTGPNV